MFIDIQQLEHLDQTLRQIVTEIESELEVQFTVTSEYRPGDPGVHGSGRGVDWRCHNHEFGQFVAKFINDRWVYDPQRPDMKVCIFHKVGGSAYHLHIQSHPNTRRKT